MLAFLHVIAIEAGVRVPGYLSTSQDLKFSDVPAGLFASLEAVPTAGWLQIMVLTCMQEAGTGFASKPQTDDNEPGDIALDSWVRYDDPEVRTFKLNVERQNGRAAMLGITGCLIHELLGVDALYPTGGLGGAAPPPIISALAVQGKPVTKPEARASVQMFQEGDIGVLPPLGVYDPLGLIETRDMRRYEIMEIKHGRAAMLAFLHVIAIEAGVRVPGYLSTSQDLKFSDVPAGLFASLEAVPTAGWLQIMVLTCMQEAGTGFASKPQTDDNEPGDIALDSWVRYDDPEVRTFKLNVERQNGRAAMLGITGCLIHELLGVDALYPTGGLGGAAPPPIIAALAVEGQEAAAPARAPAPVAMESSADLEALAKKLNPIVGFYDPLNLASAEFWQQSNESTIGFLRHAEMKHGRVAMAGFVGFCIHANGIHFPWKIPGDELCAPGVSPPLLWEGIPAEAKWQILGTIGLFELYSEAAMAKSPDCSGHYMRGGKPGVFPPLSVKGKVLEDRDGNPLLPHPVPLNLFDPFGFTSKLSDEKKAEKLNIEINNGRLAMIGLMGFLSEGAIPGSVPALTGKIPLSGEINVMSPLDFTKPLFG